VIQARPAARWRATRLTALVLAAALLRTLLLPLGDVISTMLFGSCLVAIAWSERAAWPERAPIASAARWGTPASVLAGILTGVALLAPAATASPSARPLEDFWVWAAIAALIATLEEVVIRGVLYRRWLDDAGPAAAILAGAIVFALIHLPRYGLAAMPLDLAVGMALGGLRAASGRVLPAAIAHTIADWGAWFWA
jgi:membrane protease YdiL (CAAX protease family)